MLKRVLTVAVVATAISVPAIAGAASKKHKAVHKVTSHNVTETVTIADVAPPGNIAAGRQTYAGIVDGVLGGKRISGAVRGVNNTTVTGATATFQGTITTFGPGGSITATVSGTGKGNPDGSISFTGTAQPQAGTGIYSTVKGGSLTFQGSGPPKDADGDNDAVVATFTATGTIKY